MTVKSETQAILSKLGVPEKGYTGGTMATRSPVTGETVASLPETSAQNAAAMIEAADAAFREWRMVPAPKRGEPRPISAGWCRSRPARSPPKASARCRR